VADLRQELDETNRGLIALYAELDEARAAEARLATIVQSSDDAIFSMTTDHVINSSQQRTQKPAASGGVPRWHVRRQLPRRRRDPPGVAHPLRV